MTRRAKWTAVAVGLVLLCDTALWQAVAEPLLVPGAPVPADARRVEAARRDRIASLLLARNPRLDAATSVRIADAVLRCERDHALAPDLVLRVMLVESSARPAVQSPKGAVGLMQVMPHMFRRLELAGNVAHIETNVEAGCMLLADNIRRLGEDDGISAYFWGSTIRGGGYLQRVRTVLDDVAAELEAEAAQGRG